ncbi:AI-2E family transporter [Natranaeroarchaeum sulfidigenes]|uniref:Putative PurR-regulated permease PerM n=1 Tax=Natranaeroarchaeum sulfidigenes TaxID=2784880 RepID=A0A897N1C2_9EURY|nr:AI-2E family transporter [Natranaeroarchaeum sulfidigenes]QSG04126.1 putative PurR-regulated permease PerM [Natranaeroarchaeum sulfidigenes]
MKIERMEYDHAVGRRLLVGAFLAVLFALVAYIAYSFLAVLVFAVFLYYAVRPIHRSLVRFGLPRRIRAGLSIVLFGIPFVLLLGYTLAVVAIEIQELLDVYDVEATYVDQLLEGTDLAELDLAELQSLVTDAVTPDSAGVLLANLLEVVGLVSGALVQFLVLVVLTYYMLVDGPRLVEWLLATYDESGVARRYVRAVDPELSMTLFGNIVNVFVTAIAGVITFYTYNLLAPAAVAVPYPGLIAALAGIGSLIPVVGIKLVYIPVVGLLAATAWSTGDLSLLVPVAGLLVASAVVVDFIPDFFIRAHISGDATHTGMLLVAYVVGPVVFGFYGLFLAPILLILVINGISVLVPFVLSGETEGMRQATLQEYQ